MPWIKLRGQLYNLAVKKMQLHSAKSMGGSMLSENLKCGGPAEADDMQDTETISGSCASAAF